MDREDAKKELEKIKKLHKLAKENQYSWFAGELEGLIQSLSKAGSKTGKNQNPSCLVGLTRETKVWEHTLNALLSLNKKSIPGKRVHKQKKDHDQRMVWFLDYDNNGECNISPSDKRQSMAFNLGRGMFF